MEITHRQRIVEAGNQPSPPSIFVVALVALLGAVVVFALAIYQVSGLPLPWVAIIGIVAYLPLALVTMLIANGDWLAWREVVRSTQNERLAMNRHADLLTLQETNRHVEEMARISAGAEVATFPPVATTAPPLPREPERNYIPAYTRETRDKALEWAVSMYKGGMPDPDLVSSTGYIRKGVPWGKRGSWTPAESEERLKFLELKNVVTATKNGYRLNIEKYPNLRSLGNIEIGG